MAGVGLGGVKAAEGAEPLARALLCVLKIRPTRLFGVSSERERSLRCFPPDVAVVKTAHTRQADDLGGWQWPRLHLPARR